MKNFVFISPNFPAAYWKFCAELKNNGLRVLGIGDCPYDELKQELRDNLHEYYKVANLESYDEVFRAVAFFTYKYGKIDWLESNNEYWLERDAKLRTEFHITSGFMEEQMHSVKCKSAMKAYYAKAGIPTARYHIVEGYDDAVEFANKVGYPVVVKPDNGVVCTYDAIIGKEGQPLFESGNVTPLSLMDVVNDNGESIYYIVKELPEDVRDVGLRTVKAFGVRSRFVHLEFFRLTQDQEGLGKKGDLIGLEVNMRPAGGFTPDMYNYAYETDVYKIWADMIAFDKSTKPLGQRHFCAFMGRRDGKKYVMDHDAIMAKYGQRVKLQDRIPDALSGAMANVMYLTNLDTQEQVDEYFRDLMASE